MRFHPTGRGHEDDEDGQEGVLYDCNRISYWIARRLTGLAGPDYAATISFGLPFEPEDSQYGECRLNGQQTGEWTLAALVDSFELTAGRMAVAALIIPPALYLAAGWVPWEALAFASRVLFVGMVAMAPTGYGLRAWRRLKGGASET